METLVSNFSKFEVSKSEFLDALYFPVEVLPINEAKPLFGDLQFSARYAQVVHLPFFDKIVNFAGANYTLTRNEDFFGPIYDKLSKSFGSSAIQIKTLNEDDCRFRTDFIIKSKTLSVAKNDEINLMISARNSYDGTQKASIEFLTWRQICSNGLHGWASDKIMYLKHHTDLTGLLAELEVRLDSMDLGFERFSQFTDRKVTPAELELVLGRLKDLKSASAFPKKILPEVQEKIYQEMSILGTSEMSAWLLYNGFNFFLNHDTRINLKDQLKSSIDMEVLSTISNSLNISLN